MLLSVILWPFTVASNVVSFLFHCTLFVVLLPFKIIQSILRSLAYKVQNISAWTEAKIRHIKTIKPFILLFPIHQLEDTVVDNLSELDVLSAGHHHHDHRAGKRTTKQSPGRSRRHHQYKKGKHDSSMAVDQLPPVSASSMNTLIQDLLEFSKQHTSSVPPSDTSDQTISTATTNAGKEEDESEKVLKLIRDLQEIATTQTKSASPVKGQTAVVDKEERELDQMLTDLGVFEAYITKLLDEQQRGEEVGLGNQGEMPMIDIGSLETITEEETSKECSPSCGGSPAPQYSPTQTISGYHDNNIHQSNVEDHHHSQDQTHSEVSLEEFQLLLKQISDTVRQAEEDDVFEERQPSTDNKESPGGQFTETEKEFQSVIDSLETQHKFIETQHELQEMMDSLDPSTVITSSLSSCHGSSSTEPSSVPDQQQQQVYDSLNPQENSSPLYSFPKKDHKEAPRNLDTTTSSNEPTVDDSEQIYDSLLNFTTESSAVLDTPPPLPLKRIPSDGGMSTSSNEHSPQIERRRSHHSSSDDGEGSTHRRHSTSSHTHHHHSHHHRSSRRHSSRRHSSSSSKKSDCHCCYHDDESPDHHHRPRSRERHHHHHGSGHHHHCRHRSRSDSDESQCTSRRRRRPRESSGYESQEFESSPSFPRRSNRSYSEATSTTSTPREGKRGFLSGLFSRKSTTSLNSISSRMSEAGEDVSVSSYRM